MNTRIIGIDVARSLALIGMIIVNFKTVFGQEGQGWIKSIFSTLDGKAAAIFIVLAGIGIAFMTNAVTKENPLMGLKKAQRIILKRALFLFVIGLLYLPIWPADILHFYGVYMIITILFLSSGKKSILISAVSLIILFPILMGFWNYESGWNFETLNYQGFWTIKGFFRNLFFNGFHPVIPWSAFMLVGLWFGKQNLNSAKFAKKSLWISLSAFITLKLISISLIYLLAEGNKNMSEELSYLLGTSPMPPLPIYMLSGSYFAIFIISSCLLISKKLSANKIIIALSKTGQLALTFYVAHVIIGMGIIETFSRIELGKHSIQFSIIYALVFSIGCIVFAIIWTKYKKIGPLEWIMRKLTS